LGTEKCTQERAVKYRILHLPFAGIILFRFYGFNLSLDFYVKAPRERNRLVSGTKVM
jgi:hypothetical protein